MTNIGFIKLTHRWNMIEVYHYTRLLGRMFIVSFIEEISMNDQYTLMLVNGLNDDV